MPFLKKQIPFGFWLIFSGAVAFLTIIAFTHSAGIGVTHDSGVYVLVARMLWSRLALIDHTGGPSILYPPLYSGLLSLYHVLPFSIYQWAILLQALAWSGTVMLSLSIAKRFMFFSNRYLLVVAVMMLCAVPLLVNSIFLWSENIFVFFIIYSFYLVLEALEEDKWRRWVLLSMVLLLVVMQRYAGIPVVFTVSVLVFVKRPLPNVLKRILLPILIALPAFLFLFLWDVRNRLLAGGTNIHHDWFAVGLGHNMEEALYILGTFFLPNELARWYISALTALVILWFIYTWYYKEKKRPKAVALMLFFVVLYLAFFIGMNSIIFVSLFEDRYMSPLYFPMLVLLLKTIDYWMDKYGVKLSLFFGGACAALVGYQVLRCMFFYNHYSETGGGYHHQSWKNEPTIHWLAQHSKGTLLLSNDPMPLILNMECIAYAPTRPLAYYGHTNDLLYVEWKPALALQYLSLTPELKNGKYRLEPLREFPNATVYRIKTQ